MTGNAKAPATPAILLFREVDRDDRGRTAHEDVYFRIKILTEEGRKYADIEIPFYRQEGDVVGIHARTVEPDGMIVNFGGKAFTKEIVKARRVKYLAKTFTLPDVQVSSLLERSCANWHSCRRGELSVPVAKADELKKFYRIIAGDERNTVVLKAVAQ